MATCINSSRSCLPPSYTIPIFPLLNRKIFHLLVMYGLRLVRLEFNHIVKVKLGFSNELYDAKYHCHPYH